MSWLWGFLSEPTNAVVVLFTIIALMLFHDLRYAFWKASLFAGTFAMLIYCVKVMAL